MPPALPSTEIFLNKLCKNLCTCTEETRAGSLLNQIISLVIQVANAAYVLGAINDKTALEEIFHLSSQGSKSAALYKYLIDP